MKRILLLGAVVLIASSPLFCLAQCTTISRVVSYDAQVIGSGNDMYIFSVPKFDATLGNLLEVHMTSEVTINYSYDVENKDTRIVPNVRVRVNREDEISSSDLETPLTNTFTKTTSAFTLGAKDAFPGTGADFHAEGPLFIMNHTVLDKVSYNTAAFLGTGDVELTYLTSTYGLVLGSALNNFSQRTNDEMRFTVSYQFCPKSVLDEDIKTFSVTKKEGGAQIAWTTANDHNRKYEVQISTDGKIFSTIYKTNSSADGNGVGSYLYNHTLPDNASGKFLFRVKVINNDGSFHYTSLKVIELANKTQTGLKLFPNPAHDEVQLVFNNTRRGNWKVFVITSAGQALKEYSFNNALTGRLTFQGTLPKGIYFLKAINTNTQEKHVTRLVIR